MDSLKAILPDLVGARVEDLYNAQLSDEEVVAHMADMRHKAERLVELAAGGNRAEAAETVEALLELAHRVRRGFVDMAYRQGLRDGFQLQSAV